MLTPTYGAEPSTAEVTAEVNTPGVQLVLALQGEMSRQALQQALGLKHAEHFRRGHLQPAMAAGWVEMTLPDKPQSSRQRYRLTPAGQAMKAGLLGKKKVP